MFCDGLEDHRQLEANCDCSCAICGQISSREVSKTEQGGLSFRRRKTCWSEKECDMKVLLNRSLCDDGYNKCLPSVFPFCDPLIMPVTIFIRNHFDVT